MNPHNTLTPEMEAKIRASINPAYAATLGTESHERAMLIAEIDRLRGEVTRITELGHGHIRRAARFEAARDKLLEAQSSAERAQKPVAYLYHDAASPAEAHPWLNSTMLVLAADRRQGLRGETPLYACQTSAAQHQPQVRAEEMAAEIDRLRAALQSAEQRWVPLRMEWEPGYPEDVAFGTQIMMDRLKKWLDSYFEMRKPLTRQQIDDAMTEHYPLDSLLRENVDAFEACVRDIEHAHGIGKKTTVAKDEGGAS